MTKIDPALQAHKDWISFVQPTGLVVSPRALVEAQARIDVYASIPLQQSLLGVTEADHQRLLDFDRFTTEVLGWRESDLISGKELSDLSVALPDLGDTLIPTHAVHDAEQPDRWLMLVVETPSGDELDDDNTNALRGWKASHEARFERLLRERDVPIGILTNRELVRLVYAPRGESTGHLTFVVRHMCEVQGRPILAALMMLLGEQRLFALPSNLRLPAVLKQSRKYQNEVSERLAGQVLESLWTLLYGLQAADDFSRGELLRDVIARSPNDIYGGLLATIMRLVFALYAEDRALLPVADSVYENYSLLGLFERLREDYAGYPDTMTDRFGAWSQILTLFRLLHDGASHGAFRLPPRHGRLFDPHTYPFLEGGTTIPRVSDGCIFAILQRLLYLDGDRLSYAALDVEEIGSVYEAMMGFRLEITNGRSIGVKPKTKKGVRADVIVDLDALLGARREDRAKILKEEAGAEVTGRALDLLKNAATPEQIVDALGNKVSPYTPRILPKGTMALQPGEERRRSGSHYTPRSLTEPIVKSTLQPILDQLCGNENCAAFLARNDANRRDPIFGCVTDESVGRHHHPLPDQILDLKICDPAMGSGAFLVESCRFLGDALVRAWQIYGSVPTIPPDEDIVLYARRRIAQKCLYGVDRNPFAVDLAKLSLWLATLAKEHPFTFIDHALRHGDSLVGLTRDQIVHFDWEGAEQSVLELSDALSAALTEAQEKRAQIHELSDSDDVDEKQRLLADAERATQLVRNAGDLLVAAFFDGAKDRERKALRAATLESLRAALGNRAEIDDTAARLLRVGAHPLPPFHWFLEFPEVFERPNAGFDAIVGNPPFAGKNTLIHSNRTAYPDWLKVLHVETHGNADLIAQFFRRTFTLVRAGGTFGLIATNTIAQGDTRGTGLRWICKHGGTIYEARKRVKWPGAAAVVVSVIHVRKGAAVAAPRLSGRDVERITAFLFHAGTHDDPLPLRENAGKSFQGSIVLGMGFTFDDETEDATPIVEMRRLIAKNPRNAERIFPYIGGEEVNNSPTHAHRRYVIDFGDMSEKEARAGWPDLMEIVERKVKPDRDTDKRAPYRRSWWQFAEKRTELYDAVRGMDKALATLRVSEHLSFVLLPTNVVFANTLYVFCFDKPSIFCTLQSRVHGIWAKFFSSTLEERLTYHPSDCFDTFPLADTTSAVRLDTAGRAYYNHRAAMMVSNGEGLTQTYSRFHDPDERDPGIVRLRELHDAMDRAVLDAYGWTNIQPQCDFILDYEDEEGDEKSGHRKKPWRYRWTDEIRDEVLARLLALNAERARQEQLAGAAATLVRPKRLAKKKAAVPLFDQRLRPTFSLSGLAALPDGALARSNPNPAGDEIVALAAALKIVGAPGAIRDFRIATFLAMEPNVLTPSLTTKEAAEWIRLVGPEATNTTATVSTARTAWGHAVNQLRGLGRLREDLDAQTWAPGPGLDAVLTAGWPEGRLGMIFDVLKRRGSADVVASLPPSIQEWINAEAA
jgi:Eco57I restriction-modification methylase/MmeI, target recognition domain